MTVSRSGNGGPDSLVVSGLFIYDVLWSRPVRAPYQLSDVRAVSKLVHSSPSGILHLVSIDSLAQANYLSRPKGVKTRANVKRSHAGLVMSSMQRDGMPALADAFGSGCRSF